MRAAILVSLLLHAPALAQYDPEAPEPITRIRGEVVVYGGAAEGWRRDFLEGLQGEGGVVRGAPPGTDLVGELERWADLGRTPMTLQGEVEDGAGPEPLQDAAGVVLIGGSQGLAEVFAGTGTGAALKAALERGARLGAMGESARALGVLRLGAAGPTGDLGPGLDLVQGALLDPAHPGGAAPGAQLAAADALPSILVGYPGEPSAAGSNYKLLSI